MKTKVKIKDLGNVLTGNTPSKQHKEFYNSKDIGFIKPDIIDDNGITRIGRVKEYISEEARNKARIIYPGTVVVTCIGTIGKVGLLLDKEYAFNQQINAIVPNSNIDPDYLAYCMLYNKHNLINLANSAVVPIINKSDFENFYVSVSDNEIEQRNIVKVLNEVSSIINKRRNELSLLDEIIKSRFVEMFGDPFESNRWVVKKLNEVSKSIYDGSNILKDYYQNEGEVLFLRIQNVWRNEFRLDDSVYITADVNKKYTDTSLMKGDILITKIGRFYTKDSSLGRVSVYLGDDNKANYSNNIMRIRLNNELMSEFVNALLNLDCYQEYIKKSAMGGTDKRALSKKIIGEYPVMIPPLEMQSSFVRFVHQVDKSKSDVQKALNEAQQLFDSLLQKYFS